MPCICLGDELWFSTSGKAASSAFQSKVKEKGHGPTWGYRVSCSPGVLPDYTVPVETTSLLTLYLMKTWGWRSCRVAQAVYVKALRVAVELDSFQQASRQQSRAVQGVKMEESPQQTRGISKTDKNPTNRPRWADDLLKAIQGCLE